VSSGGRGRSSAPAGARRAPRPDPIGGEDSPDAGGSFIDGNTRCNIPELGQYRLLFDSDGGRLERRIYSMRADGTELEALTPVAEFAREPALSPDGTRVAYTTPEGVKILDLATRQSALFAPGSDQPAWSMDGSQIIVRVHFNTDSLEVLNATDGSHHHYVNCVGCADPSTTPDGEVIFSAWETNNGVETQFSIVGDAFVNDDTASLRRELIARAPVRMAHPTISPDELWVGAALQCSSDLTLSLWASPFALKTPACEGRRITAAGAPSATNPQWGPGVLVAYERGEPPRDLAIIAADTGEECVIAGPGDDRNPTWGVFMPSVLE
jgi:hypothetical protein